jgi:hypothetical protein
MSALEEECPSSLLDWRDESVDTADFETTSVIEWMHQRSPRFGQTDQVLVYIEDDKDGYFWGLLGSSIATGIFYIVWAILLLYLAYRTEGLWSGRLVELSQPPIPPKYPIDVDDQNTTDIDTTATTQKRKCHPKYPHKKKKDLSKDPTLDPKLTKREVKAYVHDYRHYKQRQATWQTETQTVQRRVSIMRIVVLFGCTIIIACALMFAVKTSEALISAVDAGQETLSAAEDLTTKGIDLVDDYLFQRAPSAASRSTLLDQLNSYCPNVKPKICENIETVTNCNYQGLPYGLMVNTVVDYLSILPNVLSNEIVDFRSDLSQTVQLIQDWQSTLDDFDWALRTAIAISLLLALLCIYIFMGVVLAWQNKLPRAFPCMRSSFILPLFILLVFLSWIMSSVFVMGSMALADVCVDAPDVKLLALVQRNEISETITSLVQYFVSGCADRNTPQDLSHRIDMIFQAMTQMKDFRTIVQHPGQDFQTLCGQDPTAMTIAAELAESQLCTSAHFLSDVRSHFNSCPNWYPLYETAAYDTMCYSGTDGLAWLAITQCIIVFVSMLVLTMRVAFYPVALLDGPSEVESTSLLPLPNVLIAKASSSTTEELEEEVAAIAEPVILIPSSRDRDFPLADQPIEEQDQPTEEKEPTDSVTGRYAAMGMATITEESSQDISHNPESRPGSSNNLLLSMESGDSEDDTPSETIHHSFGGMEDPVLLVDTDSFSTPSAKTEQNDAGIQAEYEGVVVPSDVPGFMRDHSASDQKYDEEIKGDGFPLFREDGALASNENQDAAPAAVVVTTRASMEPSLDDVYEPFARLGQTQDGQLSRDSQVELQSDANERFAEKSKEFVSPVARTPIMDNTKAQAMPTIDLGDEVREHEVSDRTKSFKNDDPGNSQSSGSEDSEEEEYDSISATYALSAEEPKAEVDLGSADGRSNSHESDRMLGSGSINGSEVDEPEGEKAEAMEQFTGEDVERSSLDEAEDATDEPTAQADADEEIALNVTGESPKKDNAPKDAGGSTQEEMDWQDDSDDILPVFQRLSMSEHYREAEDSDRANSFEQDMPSKAMEQVTVEDDERYSQDEAVDATGDEPTTQAGADEEIASNVTGESPPKYKAPHNAGGSTHEEMEWQDDSANNTILPVFQRPSISEYSREAVEEPNDEVLPLFQRPSIEGWQSERSIDILPIFERPSIAEHSPSSSVSEGDLSSGDGDFINPLFQSPRTLTKEDKGHFLIAFDLAQYEAMDREDTSTLGGSLVAEERLQVSSNQEGSNGRFSHVGISNDSINQFSTSLSNDELSVNQMFSISLSNEASMNQDDSNSLDNSRATIEEQESSSSDKERREKLLVGLPDLYQRVVLNTLLQLDEQEREADPDDEDTYEKISESSQNTYIEEEVMDDDEISAEEELADTQAANEDKDDSSMVDGRESTTYRSTDNRSQGVVENEARDEKPADNADDTFGASNDQKRVSNSTLLSNNAAARDDSQDSSSDSQYTPTESYPVTQSKGHGFFTVPLGEDLEKPADPTTPDLVEEF